MRRKVKSLSCNCIALVAWCIVVLATPTFSSALNLDKVKVDFLNGDYKAAIFEGERILANSRHSSDLDELYYLLGLSYTREGNYLRASDIFEIILREFKASKFKDEAKLGLGDSYLLRGELDKAAGVYEELISDNPGTKLRPQVYYRLSQIAFKKDDAQKAKVYLDKLKQEYPQNRESRVNKDLCSLADYHSGLYYTVQVGSFSKSLNAQNLTQKLTRSGYPAYIEEISDSGTDKMYRVKVGKLKSRHEAAALEDKLSQEGYPTKICP